MKSEVEVEVGSQSFRERSESRGSSLAGPGPRVNFIRDLFYTIDSHLYIYLRLTLFRKRIRFSHSFD